MRIGIDFDNTIVDYDALFAGVAAERGAIALDVRGKEAVRDAMRAGAGGEPAWMDLQAEIYGVRIVDAPPFAGAASFIRAARAAGHELAVVSHKTRYAAARPAGANLHDAARAWLAAHDLLGPQAFRPEDVFFAPTREEKIARLVAFDAALMIDDLVEVFAHPAFPASVERWLFAPYGVPPAGAWRAFASWDAMLAALPR